LAQEIDDFFLMDPSWAAAHPIFVPLKTVEWGIQHKHQQSDWNQYKMMLETPARHISYCSALLLKYYAWFNPKYIITLSDTMAIVPESAMFSGDQVIGDLNTKSLTNSMRETAYLVVSWEKRSHVLGVIDTISSKLYPRLLTEPQIAMVIDSMNQLAASIQHNSPLPADTMRLAPSLPTLSSTQLDKIQKRFLDESAVRKGLSDEQVALSVAYQNRLITNGNIFGTEYLTSTSAQRSLQQTEQYGALVQTIVQLKDAHMQINNLHDIVYWYVQNAFKETKFPIRVL
jgi:hypothetical protein